MKFCFLHTFSSHSKKMLLNSINRQTWVLREIETKHCLIPIATVYIVMAISMLMLYMHVHINLLTFSHTLVKSLKCQLKKIIIIG